MQTPDDMAAIAYKGLESAPTWLLIVVLLLAALGIVLALRDKRKR
ncbi:hypothetical protein AB0I94_14190 [Streptomyces sp. NPDC050147]